MRRRKKDKLTKPASYAEAAASAAAADTLLDNFLHIHHHNTVPTTAAGDSSLTPAVAVAEGVPSSGSLGKISLLAMARSRSPPQQQRRRSGLLGLSGSVRELVEQVQDSLSKSRQEIPVSTSTGVDAASTDKPSRSLSMKLSKSSSSSNPSSTHSTPASPIPPVLGGSAAIGTRASPAPTKKKVLDLKLLSTGTSLSLRMKKPLPSSTPSPSEFKSRARPDLVEQPFCGVCATPFSIMVRRQRCQVCKEGVCAQCSTDKRYVEGHKGLQRVCDICIVEGPVVLDENGMYAVDPSPASTPIPLPLPPAPTQQPPQLSTAPADTVKTAAAPHRPPATTTATVGTVPKVAATPRAPRQHATGTAVGSTIMHAQTTEPTPETSITSSTITKHTQHPGNTAARKLFADSPASAAGDKRQQQQQPQTGSIFVGTASQVVHAGYGTRGDGVPGGNRGVSGGGRAAGGGPCRPEDTAVVVSPARELAEERALEAASAAAAAALGGDDDDDDRRDGGMPAVAAPARQRRRSKKARRAALGALEASKATTPQEKVPAWSAQSFADFLGIGSSYASANAEGSGGGTAGDGGDCITPLSTSRSSRSSQNDHRDRGFSSHSAGAGAVASTAGVGVPTTPASGSTAGGGGGGGGGSSSARKWESTGKRRSSSGGSGGAAGARNGGEGRRAVVRQSSGFVRDFIRGAGIHRLDPRRLAGPLSTWASWMCLDRIVETAWTLLHKLLQGNNRQHAQRSNHYGRHGGGGGARGRGGNGGSAGREGARRWRPGRRVVAFSSVVLLASYRRYQVTHPEVTAEHVVGSATAVVFALACFLTQAVVDLARDACGAVLPSICGCPAQPLLAFGAGHADGGTVGSALGAGNGGGDSIGGGGSTATDGGGQGGAADGEGHELDRFFFL